MNFKISFFNKTVFKCDIKRLWWISALSGMLMFLSETLPLYNSIKHYTQNNMKEYIQERITHHFCEDLSYLSVVFALITAAALSTFLFSYINKANSVSCIHGFPITRGELYFSHFISGCVLMVIPFVLNSVFWFSPFLSNGVSVKLIFDMFYEYIVYGLLAFSLVTAVGMVTGNSAAQVIFSGIIALIPLFFTTFVLVLCNGCLYGFNDNSDTVYDFLSEYIYIMPQELLSARSLIYIVLIIIFIFVGLMFYKHRQLENNGEIIAFPSLKGAFSVAVALCSGMLGYFYCVAMWDITILLVMLPFSLIGLVIAHMLNRKSFTVKGILKPLIVAVVLDVAIFSFVEFDISGFEKRVPEQDDVLCVELTDEYYRTVLYDEMGEKYEIYDVFEPVFYNPEEIGLFIALHENKVANMNVEETYADEEIYNHNGSIRFAYTLKNGNKMYRHYTLSKDDVDNFLSKIHETDTYRAFQYPILDGTAKIYQQVSIYDAIGAGNGFSLAYYPDNDGFDKILEALIMDRQNISFVEMNRRYYESMPICIDVSYKKQGIDKYGNLIDKYAEYTDSYKICEDDVNTMAVLKELGFFESYDRHSSFEELKSVEVYISDIYSDAEHVGYGEIPQYLIENLNNNSLEITYENSDTANDIAISEKVVLTQAVGSDGVKFTDEQSMKALYDLAFNGKTFSIIPSDFGTYILTELNFEFDDGAFRFSFWADINSLPQFVLEYFAEK